MSTSVSDVTVLPLPSTVVAPEISLPRRGVARVAFAENRQRRVSDEWSKIVIWGGIYSLLTLTFYRFWMKTQQRRLIWRETRVDGDGFEYTGTPLELFIGSMIAIVILAAWFGIANLGLSFLQIAAWQNFQVAYILAPLIFAPLIAFATYRARRYRMLRTKWRGVRFGMDGSGIKFTGKWLLWSLIQIVTLGLLTPQKRMALEGYMTKHMLYGDARFRWEPHKGATKRLFGHWLLPWSVGALLAGASAYNAYKTNGFSTDFENIEDQAEAMAAMTEQMGWMFGIMGIAFLLVYPLYLRYKSREIAAMLSARRLLDARCESRLTWGVTAKPVLASIGYGILLSIPISLCLGMLLFLCFGAALALDGKTLASLGEGAGLEGGFLTSLPSKIAFFSGLYIYYGGFILFSMWLSALIYFRRLITYICRRTVVHDIDSLDVIRQRTKDDQLESEGFADALDIGGI